VAQGRREPRKFGNGNRRCKGLPSGVKVKVKAKDKVDPITGHEGPEGKQMYSSTLPSTLALDGSGCSVSRPGHFIPQEGPCTHCTGGLVGPRAGLNR
jgi:hypothetical protein